MKRNYDIFELEGKKQLTIKFEDPIFQPLADFLIVEVPIFENEIKKEIDEIYSENRYGGFGGNMLSFEGDSANCTVSFDLDSEEFPPPCFLSMREFKKIVYEWCEISAKVRENETTKKFPFTLFD